MEKLAELQAALNSATDTKIAIFHALEAAKNAPVLDAPVLVALEDALNLASKTRITKKDALEAYKKAQLNIAEKIVRIEDARVIIFGAQEALRTAGELTDAQKNSTRHALTALRLEFDL